MTQVHRIETAPDGTQFMDPFDLFENYVERYGLADGPDHEFKHVVTDFSEFCAAQALTGSLFAVAAAAGAGEGGGGA